MAAVGSACQVSRHCRLVNVGSCDGPTVSDSSRVGAALAAMLACVSVTHSGWPAWPWHWRKCSLLAMTLGLQPTHMHCVYVGPTATPCSVTPVNHLLLEAV